MLLRNLATEVLDHERIETTLAKAKEVQPIVEKLITLARGGWNLNNFRRVLSVVTRKDVAFKLFMESKDEDGNKVTAIGARFKDRPGGYTRIYRLAKLRQGDCSQMAVLTLLGENEKPKTKAARPTLVASNS